MVAVIHDPDLEQRLIAERQADGSDRFDEVWEGVYNMAPMPNDEQQQLVAEFTTILTIVVKWQRLGVVLPGINVSNRRSDWQRNFRCPDVAVFLKHTKSENRGTHWLGGPDLAIEIVSEGDRTFEKLPFYGEIGTRELLVVERDPWRLRLYRLEGTHLVLAGESTAMDPRSLVSEVVPLSFKLQSDVAVEQVDGDRPCIVIHSQEGSQQWTI